VPEHPEPSTPDGDAHENDRIDAADIFAGLTAIDVIEGELVPRRRLSR
jgi:hypothetical protein